MNRIVYVNGAYVPEAEARISIFDRGFIFSDGVYEVSAVIDGKLVDNDGHIKRLERSLNELKMDWPIPAEDIVKAQEALIEKLSEADQPPPSQKNLKWGQSRVA